MREQLEFGKSQVPKAKWEMDDGKWETTNGSRAIGHGIGGRGRISPLT